MSQTGARRKRVGRPKKKRGGAAITSSIPAKMATIAKLSSMLNGGKKKRRVKRHRGRGLLGNLISSILPF